VAQLVQRIDEPFVDHLVAIAFDHGAAVREIPIEIAMDGRTVEAFQRLVECARLSSKILEQGRRAAGHIRQWTSGQP
jgi:hypothetical protein